jgi:hypothetical protein
MNGCHVQPEQFFNLIFGYHDRYVDMASENVPVAGTRALFGTAVPSDEVWVVTCAVAFNATRATSFIDLGVAVGAAHYVGGRVQAGGAGVSPVLAGPMVMKNGDKLVTDIGGCLVGDWIYLFGLGYKMKITQ